MTDREHLTNKVNGRIVGILSHGNSVKQLEQHIGYLSKYNICWVSFNNYPIFEKYILSKIEKKLDVILDCAMPSDKNYERMIRIPNFIRMLKQKTTVISSLQLMEYYDKVHHIHDYENKYQQKLLFIENFKIDTLHHILENTFAYLIGIILSANPKRIILFGADGFDRSENDAKDSYYRREDQNLRRDMIGKVSLVIGESLIYDTKLFKEKFSIFLEECYKLYNIEKPIQIINCSPGSCFTNLKTINYNELEYYL